MKQISFELPVVKNENNYRYLNKNVLFDPPLYTNAL